jgi:3-oxoadipate enol-lactonase
MKREFATINDCRIAYALEGKSRSPVVVLSHALAARAEIWSYQLPLLVERFRVLTYDLRGHGQSEAIGDSCSLPLLASDVARLLDYLGIERAAFVGLSIGGMIGQQFALDYPEKLLGLVLCSTGSHTDDKTKAVLAERINVVRREGLDGQVQPTLRRWFTSRFIEEAPCTMNWVSELISSTSVEGYIKCCQALQELDLTRQLSRIQTRTLLIPGSEDASFPEESSRLIQKQIAGSEVAVLSQAAHLGLVERAHVFNEILLPFLDRVLGK